MKNDKIKVSFKATKLVSRPARISFRTRDGRSVVFRASEDVPQSVRVGFVASRKKK